jgi:hypothetical protein
VDGRPETTETIMGVDQREDETPEKIGKLVSNIFLAALAVLFLYGYLRHFF